MEKKRAGIAATSINMPFIKQRKQGALYNLSNDEYVPREDVDNSLKIIIDGAKNDFPLYLINVVTSSPTASSCMSTYDRHLRGKGFNYEDFTSHIVNKQGQTAGNILKLVSRDMSYLRRFAIRVKYTPTLNEDGTTNYNTFKAELFHVPAKWVRYEVDDNQKKTGRFKYNPYYGSGDYNTHREETVVFYPFNNDPATILKQVRECSENGQKYAGQLYWYNEEPMRNGVYSFPEYFSAEDAIKADIEINSFNFNNIINSFLLPSLMVLQGDPNEQVPDPFNPSRSMSRKELFEEQMSEAFSGAENAGKMLVYWVRNIEESAKFLEFPTNKQNTDQYVNAGKYLTEQIARASKVPPILANIETPGKLGNTKEVQMSMQVMNAETEDNRNVLSHCFDTLAPLTGFVKEHDKPIKLVPQDTNFEIPQWVADYLPTVEKDEYIENTFGLEIDRGEVIEEIDAPMFNKKL